MILFTYRKLFNHFSSFLMIMLPINLFAQSINFNHLTTTDGLSNNYVYDLIQDRLGFLWFATDDGLNRFDGYEFKVFRNNPNDKNSISDNSVWTLVEDKQGKIWVGTKNGFINCYDPVFDKFTHWQIKSDITKENPITTIYIDSKDSIWIGTYRSGVYKLNPKTGKTTHWAYHSIDTTSLSNNYISSIVEDNFGNIWIGTFNGLNKFNPQKSKTNCTKYFNIKNNKNCLTDNLIWAITPSLYDKNILWVGTADGLTILNTAAETFNQIKVPNPDKLQFGTGTAYVLEEVVDNDKIIWTNSYSGLIRYNVSKNNFSRFLNDKNDPHSLISNQINNIYKDRSGVLWIATHNGISYFSQKNIKFNNELPFPDNYFSSGQLNKLNTKAITQSGDGALWIGTDNGLFYSPSSNGKLTIQKHTALSSENIWSLAAGNSDDIWIGTYGSGLYQLNYKTNQLSKRNILDKIDKTSSKNFVKSLLVDNKNNVWVGYWGVGLARLNTTTNEINHWHHLKDKSNSLSHDDVWVIFQDSKNRIWIGTHGGGLNLYNESIDGNFFQYIFREGVKNCLGSNSIYCVNESNIITAGENQTTLWIGTNNGLNKFVINDAADNSVSNSSICITTYTIEDGLADNSIKSIVEDKNGNLWLGTSTGISFFNLQKNVFTNFTSADGVIGVDFNLSSALMYDNDLVLMGSSSGLNYFDPNRIIKSSYKPPIVITDFQIFNNPVPVAQNSALTKNIFYTDEITFSHTQNVFSFEFSALDFNSTNSIKYAYKMEGFDKDWIQSGTRRFITYTNLNPGKYVFKVKSTNSDGIWNDNTASVKVIITPPWWQTGWAIILYFIISVVGIWKIIKFQSNRMRLQNELRVREFESYHLREIEKMKSRFFANLSHEFRTPLMLIKGPLESLLSGKISENISDYYKMLLRNTEKLQKLIDQLLELSQLESESIPLKIETHDLVTLVKSFTLTFIPLAEQKKINFSFISSVQTALASIDKDKLEKTINNLLSNAFKFTPVSGIISVNLFINKRLNSDFAIISVKDSGVGIPGKYQTKIFDRFYQVDDSSKRNYGGSGIGLALVKELVTLNKWDIEVNSSEGKGTEFILSIPLMADEKINETNQTTDNVIARTTGQIPAPNDIVEIKTFDDQKDKPLILFVEDSEDVRKYVYDLLKSDYNVLLAESGEAGIEATRNNLPDLIVSDVMMPGMDGFEFCKQLKTDWQTSHIPVILLTAKVTHQSKLEGLELGADDYITKPFDYKEFSIRINNLITQRKQLKDKFSKEINVRAESISNNASDNEFIQKIIDTIEKNLNNEKFNSDTLAKELFLSRSQLNRKLQAIANQGPGEFIRTIKLKRAAQMILENRLSITQIAYEVGFGSPAQFSRAFQKHFSCLPSEFKQSK